MTMAAGIDGAGFWLPSDFLTDDDFLTFKHDFDYNEQHSDFAFPSEFPYHSEISTHHLLQKSCMISTSPQSTLSDFGRYNSGSPNGAQSPHATSIPPKLNRGYALNSYPPPINPTQFSHTAKIPSPSVYLNAKFENVGARAVRGADQVAFSPHQITTTGRAAFISGGAAVKKACAGTGVFLPRRYENLNMSHSNVYSPGTYRKPGCSASPFQGRASSQIYTKPCNSSTFRFAESQAQQLHPRAFISDLVVQQRRSFLTPVVQGPLKTGRDHPCLPLEWTY